MSTALYRRYRPETFTEVIGQEHVTDPLMQALRSDKVTHAYLFSGPRGCGKTTSARILARCLNCAEGPTDTPCGRCPSCVELARGGAGSLDVVEIDAASHGGVDDARDLRERATFAPARDRFKIFILDEAHMVTSQGFNALLKIVEEPPEHVKFVFATTEPDKVIGTIRSRTHHYPFRLVAPDTLLPYLEKVCTTEGVPVGAGVLPLVVRAGGGSVRDSMSVLDQLVAGATAEGIDYERAVALLGYTHAALLDDTVDAIAARDGASAFRVVDRVVSSGHEPRRFVEDLLERLRDLIVIAASGEAAQAVLRDLPADQLERMRAQATVLGAAELSRSADLVNEALTEMTGATSPRLHLELLVARLLLPAADDGARGLGARIDRVERELTGGARPAAAPVVAPAPVAATAPAPAVSAAPPPVPPAAPIPVATVRPVPSTVAAEQGPSDPQRQTTPDAAPTADAPSTPDAASTDDARTPSSAAPGAAAPGSAAPGSAPHGSAPHGSTPHGSAPRGSAAPEVSPDGVPTASAEASAKVAPEADPVGPATPEPEQAAPTATPPTTPATAPPPTPAEPSAPAPAPSAAPVATPGLDAETVRRRWPEVLQTLRGLRMATWVLVSQNAHVAGVAEQTLSLAFSTPQLATTFRTGPHPENVQRALHETLGLDLRIETALADAAPPAPPADPAGQPGDAPGSDGGGRSPAAAGGGGMGRISTREAEASWDVPATASAPDRSAAPRTAPEPTGGSPRSSSGASPSAGAATPAPSSAAPREAATPAPTDGIPDGPEPDPEPEPAPITSPGHGTRPATAGGSGTGRPSGSAAPAPYRGRPGAGRPTSGPEARQGGGATGQPTRPASEDDYDPDDPDLASSGLVGAPLVAQMLGGTVIDEIPDDPS